MTEAEAAMEEDAATEAEATGEAEDGGAGVAFVALPLRALFPSPAFASRRIGFAFADDFDERGMVG